MSVSLYICVCMYIYICIYICIYIYMSTHQVSAERGWKEEDGGVRLRRSISHGNTYNLQIQFKKIYYTERSLLVRF